MSDILEFDKLLGYKFKNIAYLKNALTHTSYINEQKNTRNLIAYHWKWQPDNKDIQATKKRYNIFVKTVYKSIRWWTVIKYTGFLLLISVLASFLVALWFK